VWSRAAFTDDVIGRRTRERQRQLQSDVQLPSIAELYVMYKPLVDAFVAHGFFQSIASLEGLEEIRNVFDSSEDSLKEYTAPIFQELFSSVPDTFCDEFTSLGFNLW
jgi:hypothetical protein